MVGMGSWANVDPQIRARADDIDATVAYPEDPDNPVARAMVGKFQVNLRRWSDATGINPDIRLFFHDPETEQEEMYRGPTGELFFFRYSKQNNPNSAFEVGLEEGELVQRSLPTEAFWRKRGKKVPDRLLRAHLFVEDNRRFTRAMVGKERPALRRAVKIAKYVDRVEAFLKDAVLEKWGKTLPVQTEAARQMVRVVNCIRGQWLPLDALASVVMESEEETRRVRECLKGMPGEGPGQQTAALYRRADAYFQATREQVRSAEPQQSWWH